MLIGLPRNPHSSGFKKGASTTRPPPGASVFNGLHSLGGSALAHPTTHFAPTASTFDTVSAQSSIIRTRCQVLPASSLEGRVRRKDRIRVAPDPCPVWMPVCSCRPASFRTLYRRRSGERAARSKPRASTLDLIQHLRAELWGEGLRRFCDFASTPATPNRQKLSTAPPHRAASCFPLNLCPFCLALELHWLCIRDRCPSPKPLSI